MTQRTKAGLQTNLNTDLADNSTGDISAADVRGNLIDFTDSVPFLSTADNKLSGSFSGSFEGDGSNLTGITVDTGSLATTGSNTFTGNQTFNSSIQVLGNNAITIGPNSDSNQDYYIDCNNQLYIRANQNPSDDLYTDLFLQSGTSTETALIGIRGSSADSIIYFDTSNTRRMEIKSDGEVNIKKSLIVTGSAEISGSLGVTGSLDVTGGITGSVLGTGSYALSALTASYALNSAGGGGSTFPYTGSAGISGSLDVVGDFTVDVASGASYNSTTGSILVANLEVFGNESALMRGRVNTEIRGESFYDANPALPGNVTIANSLGFGSTKGYTKIDAGNLYMSGSTLNSTGSWTHANDLTVQGVLESPTLTKLSGSLELTGSLYIPTGTSASIQTDYVSITGNESAYFAGFTTTYLEGASLTSLDATKKGNIVIQNTEYASSTKGYTKIDAGNFFISASAVYIQTSSLPTSEPATSGQLWLSGSAGNSKYLMVRD